jgi:TolB-like protein/tetratricopeptide (TPR) repeat protein/predicted Ser/Thr protein kinase
MDDRTRSNHAPLNFGRYQVVGHLGKGGMGEVWKAWDPHLDRHVALKFLSDDRAHDESARARFLREGRAASRLKHDGIATVFDAGEIEGKSYIAFEFVDGESVAKRLGQGPFPASEAVKVALAAAEALAHAHASGVFHRDITPGNIMITRDGRVVIVDFGLAVAEGAERLTRSGTTLGTVAYMSPEALRGIADDDHTGLAGSDLWGLGVTLSEMLTGSLPFAGAAPPQLMYSIANDDPVPPSKRLKTLPASVDELVLRSIAKAPANRFQDAATFAAALHQLLNSGTLPAVAPGEEIVRKAPTVTPRTWNNGRRRRRIVAVAFGLVAVAAVVTYLLWPRTGEPAFASIAVLPFAVSGPDTSIAGWLTAGLGRETVIKLSKLRGIRVVTWTSSQRYRTNERPLKEIASELGVEAIVVGSVERRGNRLVGSIELVSGEDEFVHWSGSFDLPEDELFAIETEIATGVARGIFGDVSRDAVGALAAPASHSVEAYEHYLRGAEAMQTSTPEANATALAFFERALELDSNLADAMVGVGAVHVNRYFFGWEGGQQNLDAARRWFDRALDLAPDNRDALRGVMSVAFEEGHVFEALQLGTRADVGAGASVDDLLTRAQGYVTSGLPGRAIPLLRRALGIEPSNPAVVWWLVIADNWSGAYEDCVSDAELFFTKFGEDPEVHLWLSDAYWWLSDPDAAVVHARRSLELFGEYPQDYAELGIATRYLQMGLDNEGTRLLRAAIARIERSLATNPGNQRYMRSLALCYALDRDSTRFVQVLSELKKDELWSINERAFAPAYARLGMMEDARRVICSGEPGGVIGGGPASGELHNLAAFAGTVDPEFRECMVNRLQNFEKLTTDYCPP